MIESGHIDRDDPVLTGAVARALEPLRGRELDAVLLGCTHYGIIEDAIRDCLGAVPLLSAADCGARAERRTAAPKSSNWVGSTAEQRKEFCDGLEG